MTNAKTTCLIEEHARRNVGFREHNQSPERRDAATEFPGLGRYAQNLLEPISQEMTAKKNEQWEAHLQEIRIAATCAKQIMGRKRFAKARPLLIAFVTLKRTAGGEERLWTPLRLLRSQFQKL